MVVTFARLKLRVIGNGLRGSGWRIAMFVIGAVFALWFAATGFFLLAAPGLADHAELSVVVPAFAGAAVVLGWLLLPLVFFGVDETLDPARFALLPLPRRTLVTGLFTAALLGMPALAMLAATSGLVLGAGVRGGWTAALAQALGVIAGLLECVAVSRAVTSAFATLLRSRRMRDLAAIALAVLAALFGPLQIALRAAVERADYHALLGPARVLGWTPLAAPYTVGTDVVEGHAWAVPLKLAIAAVTIAALLWWWSASLESAMVGTVSSGPAKIQEAKGGAVAQLFPRTLPWLPRTQYGAIVAREARYWWRDARRRANLITIAVMGVFVPLLINLSRTPTLTSLSISTLLVGVYGAVVLANQFGFEGTAYAVHLITGVPGRTELRARAVAISAHLVPVLTVIAILISAVLREPSWLPVTLGGMYAAYGTGVAVNLFTSIFGAYPLPESSNPFAMNSGGGLAKSLLAFVAMLATAALTAPFGVATILLGGSDLWTWLALPAGVAYGLAAVSLGSYIAGDALDHRGPELLLAVSSRR